MELLPVMEWFAAQGIQDLQPIVKDTTDTSAWIATLANQKAFFKFYPKRLDTTRADVEIAIAGANLHPAIVPLRQTVACADGVLLIYDHVAGISLGPMEARQRFQSLPLHERIHAVSAILTAIGAICEAGFMIVDWYEGNMMYDFNGQQIWLFDWELCRRGDGFTLEMENNYGSSRLMAPEEFLRGSRLDQQTLVFNLGRYALLTLPELAEPLAPVLALATYPARRGRFAAIHEFMQAFTAALSSYPGLG